MADKRPSLTDSVPKIIITEPSPMPISSSGLIQQVLDATKHNEVEVPDIPEPSPTKADYINEATYLVDTEENVTTDSDASCSVSVEDKLEEVALEVGQTLTPPEEVEVEMVGVVEEGVYGSCCRWMDSFSESKFMLPILTVLLAMPISAGLMGARYMDKCPLSSETPLFLFMMGVCGSLVIICRMGVILQRTVLSRQAGELPSMRNVVVFGCMAIVLLLCTEMVSFLRISPNFEPGTPNYCHRIFYNFTYWLNWTSLFVLAFLAVIHAPKCTRQTSQAATTA